MSIIWIILLVIGEILTFAALSAPGYPNGKYNLYINGFYNNVSSSFTTFEGLEMTYFNWKASQPETPEIYNYIRFSINNKWETSRGNSARFYICETF